MNTRQRLPYIFLIVLFIIICFVGGVQYGKIVEKANKTVNFMRSITPPPPITPSTTPSITYSQIKLEDCQISFLLPSNYSEKKISSTEAQYKDAASERTLISKCQVAAFPTMAPKQTTQAATLAGRPLTGILDAKKQLVTLQTRHTITQDYLQLMIPIELLPLLEQTFAFE